MAYRSFEEFWPYYLGEHAKPGTRWLHLIGTGLGLLCVPLAIVLREPWWLLAAPVLGYGLAWIGHFVVEHNRPATFKHPWWSFRGDMRMLRLMLTGTITAELRRLGVKS